MSEKYYAPPPLPEDMPGESHGYSAPPRPPRDAEGEAFLQSLDHPQQHSETDWPRLAGAVGTTLLGLWQNKKEHYNPLNPWRPLKQLPNQIKGLLFGDSDEAKELAEHATREAVERAVEHYAGHSAATDAAAEAARSAHAGVPAAPAAGMIMDQGLPAVIQQAAPAAGALKRGGSTKPNSVSGLVSDEAWRAALRSGVGGQRGRALAVAHSRAHEKKNRAKE